MVSPEQMQETFSKYTTAIEAHDRDGLLALMAASVVQIDPYPSAPNVGRDAVGAFFDQSWAMAERLEFLPGRAITVADRGVFPFTVRTHLADRTVVEVDVIDVMTFSADGLIADITAYVDMAGMRRVTA